MGILHRACSSSPTCFRSAGVRTFRAILVVVGVVLGSSFFPLFGPAQYTGVVCGNVLHDPYTLLEKRSTNKGNERRRRRNSPFDPSDDDINYAHIPPILNGIDDHTPSLVGKHMEKPEHQQRRGSLRRSSSVRVADNNNHDNQYGIYGRMRREELSQGFDGDRHQDLNLQQQQQEEQRCWIQGQKERFLKTGTTIVGICCRDGVILGADTRSTGGSLVMDKEKLKIHKLAHSIYCCAAGTAADCEQITRRARTHLSLLRIERELAGEIDPPLLRALPRALASHPSGSEVPPPPSAPPSAPPSLPHSLPSSLPSPGDFLTAAQHPKAESDIREKTSPADTNIAISTENRTELGTNLSTTIEFSPSPPSPTTASNNNNSNSNSTNQKRTWVTAKDTFSAALSFICRAMRDGLPTYTGLESHGGSEEEEVGEDRREGEGERETRSEDRRKGSRGVTRKPETVLILGGVDKFGPNLVKVERKGVPERVPFVALGSGSMDAIAVLEEAVSRWKREASIRNQRQQQQQQTRENNGSVPNSSISMINSTDLGHLSSQATLPATAAAATTTNATHKTTTISTTAAATSSEAAKDSSTTNSYSSSSPQLPFSTPLFYVDIDVDTALHAVRRAVQAGILNDLGSGSHVDLCVMTTDGYVAQWRERMRGTFEEEREREGERETEKERERERETETEKEREREREIDGLMREIETERESKSVEIEKGGDLQRTNPPENHPFLGKLVYSRRKGMLRAAGQKRENSAEKSNALGAFGMVFAELPTDADLSLNIEEL